MSGVVTEDVYGHRNPCAVGATALTAGAVSTTAVGTIAPTTNAGQSPTVTAVVANDVAGTFTLNPVTGGGAQAAGVVAVVTFAQPYSAVPKSVVAQIVDQAGDVAIVTAVKQPTITGFSIASAILTTAHSYTVTYTVTP